MNSSWFYTFLCFFLFTNCICISSSSTPTTVSYTDHCSSFVPESSPTTSNFGHPVPNLQTSYFTGGEKLIGRKQPNQVYYNVGKSLIVRIRPNYHKTVAEGVYKVEAFLYIRSPYQYYGNRSDSGYGGSYHRRNRARGSIKFLLTGFWSEISRKLCMVGSGSFEALNLDVVLKVNYASENSTIYTGVASGTLESIGSENDPGYFDPILIFSFPVLSNYNYSLVSREFGGGFVEVAKNQPFGVQPIRLCSLFSSILEMEYEMECRGSQDCSPLGLSRRFLDFSPIQCSERKLRFMAKLQNINYVDPEEFGFESRLLESVVG
ncbi:hypothetical protein DH2020_033501 [Rehmannia glutinosa]|uniref:DUF2921 domain-containing protein n=1 Tax=Rehmannia glutinosa TaxID=99300 RepID=A0ABR0VC69_REHGL